MKRMKWTIGVLAATWLAMAAWAEDSYLPGLWQIKNGDWANSRRELGPVMGTVGGDNAYTSPVDGTVTKWAEFDSWTYEGEIYLQAGTTYTFGSSIDNCCDICIDGMKVHSQPDYRFGSSSYVCPLTGWHSIVISLWDTGGGFGKMAAWPLGIAWNTTDQTTQEPVSGWTQLIDPGDGSLFRVMEKPKQAVVVQNMVCAQRYPWNGMVDIDYEVVADDQDADVWVYCTGWDADMNASMAPRTLSGDGAEGPVKPGKHRMTWNVTADYPGFATTSFSVKMCALTGGAPYMVVDLSGGVDALEYPVSYLDSVPADGWTDEYKTTKMVFRLIPPGTFLMGSPSGELGRNNNETQHQVKLTKPFYIGVFEVTQKQWYNVMGTSMGVWKTGDTVPANGVSYNAIRGTLDGAAWPTHNQVDADSFMGRLRSKANMMFDLPTESQWEYACRAGTTSALNNGKNLTATGANRCGNLDEVAWYSPRSETYPTTVGNFLPNAWGLYDMHGNVVEWCLDWFLNDWGSSAQIDPKGPTSGQNGCRVLRGGGYYGYHNWGYPQYCRSAVRLGYYPNYGNYSDGGAEHFGFRVACFPAD